MVALILIAFLVALVAGGMLVRWQGGHASRYSHDMPQRFHAGHVPRLGGVALACGAVVAWLAGSYLDARVVPLNVRLPPAQVLAWIMVFLPAVASGIGEDLTHRLAVRYRLLLTATTATLACVLLDLAVPRLGIPGTDTWWQSVPLLGVGLAVLAVCGLPHAFNIIDGYNGLAGFVALVTCLAIAHVALQVGDRQLALMVLCMAGATVGFLVWNYPRGMLFAGDGGAYLWGVVVAVAAVQLVQRHPLVSPWFPMLLLIYPVWETLFSIYRKTSRGTNPSVADALHFHQLIYRRIVRGVFHDDLPRQMLMRNNRTSPYLWGFTLLTVAPAVVFWRSTPVLMACCALFVATYVAGYLAIVRFRVPPWLRR
jgi:UDP-N-acetylmuramyl pentapeptide phosphotransferase/UDP-N-acetylglucosamine-1-phosphate transferase